MATPTIMSVGEQIQGVLLILLQSGYLSPVSPGLRRKTLQTRILLWDEERKFCDKIAFSNKGATQ